MHKTKIMISVEEAWELIKETTRVVKSETVHVGNSLNRVLAENILAERALPPYDRVTMDGIAISFEAFVSGLRSFALQSTQKAGEAPHQLTKISNAVEIMTGAVLPIGTDTVIKYEDLETGEESFTIRADVIVKQGQNIHSRGSDVAENELLVRKGSKISPAILSVLASCGYSTISVSAGFRVAIVSTGDELVDIDGPVLPWQIRKSNVYGIKALLEPWSVSIDLFHFPDEQSGLTSEIAALLKDFDAIILSGGVSKGKFDFVPDALVKNGVIPCFHQVAQRPGKPFWFGNKGDKVVFALPGNPVSTMACMARYVLPWIKISMGFQAPIWQEMVLGEDFLFDKPLTRLVQSAIKTSPDGYPAAYPIKENGSGDFSSLIEADGFLELPAEQPIFKKGGNYRFYSF